MSKLFVRPETKDLISLARLTRSMDGVALVEVLKAELQQTVTILVDSSDEAQMRNLQGRAQTLNSLIALLTKARETDAPL